MSDITVVLSECNVNRSIAGHFGGALYGGVANHMNNNGIKSHILPPSDGPCP